jgi:hypothetical protein
MTRFSQDLVPFAFSVFVNGDNASGAPSHNGHFGMISATLLPGGDEERTSLLSRTARPADSGYGCGDGHNGAELAETTPAPPLYRDVPWAVLFLLHWITLIWLGVWVAPKGYDALDAWDVNMTDFTNELKQNEDDVLNEDTVVDFESFMDQMADFWPVYPA